MENIDHVNRFFWLRVPILPLVLVIYLIKKITIKEASKKHVKGVTEASELDRYGKFFSFHTKYLFLTDLVVSFFFREKIKDQQTIFIVNENIDWNIIPLFAYVCRNQKHLFPKLLLNNIFIDKKEKEDAPTYWDLIDSFYGEKDLERAINSKRSFFIEKSFLDRHPKVLEKLKESLIPISPIFCFQENKRKTWYSSGKLIKTSGFATFRSSALTEAINVSFEEAKKELNKLIEKNKKNKNSIIKSLFTIK